MIRKPEQSICGNEPLSASGDIDSATQALFRKVKSVPANAELMARVASLDLTVRVPNVPRVVIVPGAFHVEHPHTGAGGERVFDLARELGFPAERVPVPGLASMARNAEALVDLLSKRRGQPIILVSLSKGGADVRTAMQRPDASSELRDVSAWVDISGMVYGTPLLTWLSSKTLRCLGVRLLLRLRRQCFADLNELRGGPGSPLDSSFTPPPHIRVIHVLGFPLQRHLSNDWARRGHARLAPLGPNDGGGILLADALRLPGEVLPVWGADHYLSPAWDIRPLLLRVLRESARQIHQCTIQPSATPAAISTE